MTLDSSTIEWFNVHGNKLLEHLSKHVVGLSWVHSLEEQQFDTADFNRDWGVQSETATAFLLATDRYCLLITAGHRITALRETTSAPRRLLKAFLHTGLHRDDGSGAEQFALSNLPHFHLDDEVLGLDYGAILLDEEAVKTATKLGNAPVFPGNWEDELDPAHIHVMLGFPVERRERTRRIEGSVSLEELRFGSPLLPLERVDDPETYSLDAPYDRFCARILAREGHFENESIFLIDINGMSGGPVFGIQIQADGCDYQLVGIQSEWKEDKGIVAACYIKPFIEAVTKRIEQATQSST